MKGFSDFPQGLARLLSVNDLASFVSPNNQPFDVIRDQTTVFSFQSAPIVIQVINHPSAAQNAILRFRPPTDGNWWLIRLWGIFNAQVNTSVALTGPLAIDGFTFDPFAAKPSGQSMTNGFTRNLWGNATNQQSLDYFEPVNCDPSYALPINKELTLYVEIDTAAGDNAATLWLYGVIWESKHITPVPPVITTVNAQTVNESWQ